MADLSHNPQRKMPLVSWAGRSALGAQACFLKSSYFTFVLSFNHLLAAFNRSFKMKSSSQGMLHALNCPMSFRVIPLETEKHQLLAVTLRPRDALRDEQHTSAGPRAFLG